MLTDHGTGLAIHTIGSTASRRKENHRSYTRAACTRTTHTVGIDSLLLIYVTSESSMNTDSIDSTESTTASPGCMERWVTACNRMIIFTAVLALVCGLGLSQTGHLELPKISSGHATPPPLDRGGRIGPLDKAVDDLRQKHWWWMQWFE